VINERLHIPPWIVEANLGHALVGSAAVYNRSLHLAERRRALERWMADIDTPAPLRPQAIFAHGDLADHLPPPAAERLRRLRQHVSDRHALIPNSQERLAISEDRHMSARRIEQLTGRRGAGGHELPETDHRVKTERVNHAKLEPRAKYLDELSTTRGEDWRRAGLRVARDRKLVEGRTSAGHQMAVSQDTDPEARQGSDIDRGHSGPRGQGPAIERRRSPHRGPTPTLSLRTQAHARAGCLDRHAWGS
jgi:hypothetical protein